MFGRSLRIRRSVKRRRSVIEAGHHRPFSASWSDGVRLWPWEEEPAAEPSPELRARTPRRRWRRWRHRAP
ncbi:MAG: hypothetical protein ACYCOU_22455 [Sulfobacillus sp.]